MPMIHPVYTHSSTRDKWLVYVEGLVFVHHFCVFAAAAAEELNERLLRGSRFRQKTLTEQYTGVENSKLMFCGSSVNGRRTAANKISLFCTWPLPYGRIAIPLPFARQPIIISLRYSFKHTEISSHYPNPLPFLVTVVISFLYMVAVVLMEFLMKLPVTR